MAGKFWQLSHEPPCRKEKQEPVKLNKKWKEWGRGGENCLGDEPPLKTALKVHARTPQSNGTWNSEAYAYAKTVNF